MTRRTFQTLAVGSAASQLVAQAGGKPRIKIGQIGIRHAHATGHLEAILKSPDYDFVGIVEPDDEARKRAEKSAAYAGLKWMTEDELLHTPGIQAVAVETHVGGLLQHAARVVDAGLHLHLDKPAGESLPEFKRILDTATAKKRLVKMGYVFRTNPAFVFMRQALKAGWLGDVFSIHAEMSKFLGDNERKPMLQYPGGSMFELGGHLIDAVVDLMGQPQKVTPFVRRTREDGFADNMLAVLEYAKATVTVRSAMIEVEGGSRRQFVLCGDKGTCEIRPLEPAALKLSLDAPHDAFKKGIQDVPLPKSPRYAADWADFAKAIRGEEAWKWTPDHDLAVQETILRASGMALT
jgi:predicted dehydrogenase